MRSKCWRVFLSLGVAAQYREQETLSQRLWRCQLPFQGSQGEGALNRMTLAIGSLPVRAEFMGRKLRGPRRSPASAGPVGRGRTNGTEWSLPGGRDSRSVVCSDDDDDPVAQSAEQLPFKQWVRGSNPRRVTSSEIPTTAPFPASPKTALWWEFLRFPPANASLVCGRRGRGRGVGAGACRLIATLKRGGDFFVSGFAGNRAVIHLLL